jgi:hypothetical protein
VNLQLNGNHSVLTMRNRVWQCVGMAVLHADWVELDFKAQTLS